MYVLDAYVDIFKYKWYSGLASNYFKTQTSLKYLEYALETLVWFCHIKMLVLIV